MLLKHGCTTANTSAPDAGKWFGFDLGYDKRPNASGNDYPLNNEQFNGNISGQSWRSAGDNVGRQYRYSYDAANRLLKADFVQKRSLIDSWQKSFNYDSWMGDGTNASSAYDLNGNIKQMQQWGWTAGNALAKIDNLTYTYQAGSTASQTFSNKLRAVGDTETPPAGLGDFTNKNTAADDYGYDVNGNLITDLNKRLNGTIGSDLVSGGAITYNHLNLPTSIAVKNDNGTAKGTIAYTYDAAGQKLRKVTTETGVTMGATSNITVTTTTTYIGGMVYESKSYSTVPATYANYTHQLQFAPHEEGRIRAVRTNPQDAITAFAYDYMLKDHLGNVRMVLTDEVKSDTYATLSFEGASGSTEVNDQNAVWENASGQSINVVSKRTSSSSVLKNSGLWLPPLDNSLLVRSSTGKVGAGKLVKVMAGDKINTSVQYYYPTTSGSGSGTGLNTLVTGLATVITNSLGSAALLKGGGASLSNGVLNDQSAINFFNNQNTTPEAGKPKAYLNVLFFDEQFNFDAGASQYQQVGTGSMTPGNPGQIGFMAGSAALAQKSGYCYIYISNESDELVYFDNLTLTHDKSSLMEETHYYPFGLTMAGISSKAAGIQENRYKYNTWERNQDLSLEIDESFYRSNDYQTGRFWQVDPETENMEMWSPYASNYDNPIRYNDPKGDQPGCCEGDPIVVIGQLARDFFENGVVPAVAWVNRNVNPVFGFANGLKILATGSNIDGEQRSSAAGVTELGFAFVPGGNLEKAGVKQVERKIVQEGGETLEKKAVENVVEVGKYKDVKNVGHHVYQEAAVKNLPGYKSAEAIAVKVEGSGFQKGTQHYLANQVQKMPGGGTLGRERAIAYKALRAMGFTVDQSKQIVRQADKYFESLGFNLSTPTRIPANRK